MSIPAYQVERRVNNLKESRRAKIIEFLDIVLTIPSLLWIYSPIIASFIISMVYFVPIAFTTWWLFSFLGHPNWTLGTLVYQFEVIRILMYILEILLLLGGCILFFWGLVTLAKNKKNHKGLAVTGPYSLIRHPQHLGIILASLAIPLFRGRVAGILSWSLFSFILLIISTLEEQKLITQYGDVYLEYMAKTGFLLPRVSDYVRKPKSITKVKIWKRYILLVLGYFTFAGIFKLIIFAVRNSEKVRIYYTIEGLHKDYWYLNLVLIALVILSLAMKRYRTKHTSRKEE